MEMVTRHPAFGEYAVGVKSEALSDDADTSVAQTIERMCEYAVRDAQSLEIQDDAQSAIALGGGDPLLGVWKLCKARFKFVQDVEIANGVEGLPQAIKDQVIEVIIPPRDLSLMYRRSLQPIEDCDGWHGYAASVLLAAGVRCYFVTVAVDPDDPSQYSHVYVCAYRNDGSRFALDASHGKFPGWECPNLFGKRREWAVEYTPVWGMLLTMALAFASVWWLTARKG
jgi:hypothetical protein